MNYLFLSILFSSLIFVLFRWIGIKKLNTFRVIVINYFIASVFGYLFAPELPAVTSIFKAAWFPGALMLGTSFIAVFYLMAITTQSNGTSVAVVANKMSLVIPVIFAILYYGDDLNKLKVAGIITALAGVYLSVMKPSGASHGKAWYPVLLFFCSGAIDVGIKHIQHTSLSGNYTEAFVPTLFMFAFLAGSIVVMINTIGKGLKWHLMTVIAGIILGIVNFFSIHYLVKALAVKELQSSEIFPLNNISIVLLSTICGMVLFKEKLTTANKIGILLSITAIALIYYSR